MLRALLGLANNGTFANPTFTGTVKGAIYRLAQWGVPFVHVSSGSIGNNGALTAITALPTTYGGGAWVYYPANAIAAGVAAGWYWTVFSSTTAGTIYNSTYTSGAPTVGVTTAFATTGPGAFVGDTTERVGPQITVPANAMGANGKLIHSMSVRNNNTAGNKTYNVRYSGGAGSPVYQAVQTTATFGNAMGYIQNRGLTNSQVIGNIVAGIGDSIGAAYPAVDTTADSTVAFTLVKATATDNAIIERGSLDLSYSA